MESDVPPDGSDPAAFELHAVPEDAAEDVPPVLLGHKQATQYHDILQRLFAPYEHFELVKLQDFNNVLTLIAIPVLSGKRNDPVLVKLSGSLEENEVRWGKQIGKCVPDYAAQVRGLGTRNVEMGSEAAGLVMELKDACWCVPEILASDVQMLTTLKDIMHLAYASDGMAENPGGGSIDGTMAYAASNIVTSLAARSGLLRSLLADSKNVVRAEDPIFNDTEYETANRIQLHTMGKEPGYPGVVEQSVYAKRFKPLLETLDEALFSREGGFGKARQEMRKLRAALIDLGEAEKKDPGLRESWKPVCALTHGNLYCSNLVVDLFQHIWCIEYSAAEQSPVLKDLGKLISSLVLECSILPIAIEDLIALVAVEGMESKDLERWLSVEGTVASTLFADLKKGMNMADLAEGLANVCSKGFPNDSAKQRETLVRLQRLIVGSRDEAKDVYQEALAFSNALVRQLGNWGKFDEIPDLELRGQWKMAWKFVGQLCRMVADTLADVLKSPELQPLQEIDASPYTLYCPIMDAALHFLSSMEVSPWQKLFIQEFAALLSKAMTSELNSRIPEVNSDSDDEKPKTQAPSQGGPVTLPAWLAEDGGELGIVQYSMQPLLQEDFSYDAEQRLLYFSDYQRKWVEGVVMQRPDNNRYVMSNNEEIALNELNHTPAWLTKIEFDQCAMEYREFIAVKYASTRGFTGERMEVRSMPISVKSTNALPRGWEAAAGENSQIYYFNRDTGAVQWDHPGGVESEVQRDAWTSVIPNVVAPHALDDILKPFLVLGPTASGKTFFCHRIVMECVANSDGPLPIVIPIDDLLRMMVEARGENDILNHFLNCTFEGSSPRCGMLKMAITSRRAVLIFDGLEKGGNRRQEFEQYITTLAQMGHRVVCSSRPEGCNMTVFTVAGFTILELQEFDDSKQKLSAQVRLQENAVRFCNRFLNAVEWSDSKGNPLVLNMLMSYSESQKGEVSNLVGVREIYDHAIGMMLQRIALSNWGTHDEMTLWCDRSRDTLSRLALGAHVKGVRDFSDADADSQIGDDQALRESWEDLRDRIFEGQIPLLTSFVDSLTAMNMFRFSHLTFQEFFTANYAAANYEAPQVGEDGQPGPMKLPGFPEVTKIIADPRWTKCLTFLFEDSRVKVDTLSLRDPSPGDHLGASGAWILAGVLQRAKAVQHVDIRGNNIGDDGALALASALQTNQVLQTLYVSENHLDPRGAVTPLGKDALRQLAQTNPGLRVIFSGW